MRRIILAGCGPMGSAWANAIAQSDRWLPAAYVDVDKKNLMATASAHSLPKERCFTDLKTALLEVEADALMDATPQSARKDVCSAAFERGLHVLSEKPLADTLRNAKTIIRRAKKAEVAYRVAQNYRYRPQTQTVKRQVEQGKLGDLGYVSISFHKGPRFGGFREQMDYPLVLDMSIHHLDMLRCMTGADIAWVQAESVNAPWNWNKGDATVMAQLGLSNGAAANYVGSWVAMGRETTWNADWRLEGSKGVLAIEDDEVRFADTPARGRKVRLLSMSKTDQAYLLDDFARDLDEGREPETSGENNLNSLAATFAVVESIKKGRRVEVQDLLGSK